MDCGVVQLDTFQNEILKWKMSKLDVRSFITAHEEYKRQEREANMKKIDEFSTKLANIWTAMILKIVKDEFQSGVETHYIPSRITFEIDEDTSKMISAAFYGQQFNSSNILHLIASAVSRIFSENIIGVKMSSCDIRNTVGLRFEVCVQLRYD